MSSQEKLKMRVVVNAQIFEGEKRRLFILRKPYLTCKTLSPILLVTKRQKNLQPVLFELGSSVMAGEDDVLRHITFIEK